MSGDARERVVPGITLETRLGGEQPERGLRSALESGKAEGAMERLGLGRLGVGLHHQRAGTHRRKGGPLVPIVRVGDGGTPGPQLGGRHGHLDPGLFRLVPVGPGNPRGRVGLRHGAVDGKPRGLAHLFQKRGLHRFLSRGQDQLKIGAGVDVGPCRPDAAFHRVDLGQAHRQGQAVEVDVGDAVARMAVLEDAEHEAVAGARILAGDAPAQRATPAREGEKPEPGGIFRLGDAGLPVALAEGQQDCGIGDPGAVVGEGNAGTIAILLDGRGEAVGPAAA